MVGRVVVPPGQKSSNPKFDWCFSFRRNIFQWEATFPVVVISSISRLDPLAQYFICAHRGMRAYIHRGECMYVSINIVLCFVTNIAV